MFHTPTCTHTAIVYLLDTTHNGHVCVLVYTQAHRRTNTHLCVIILVHTSAAEGHVTCTRARAHAHTRPLCGRRGRERHQHARAYMRSWAHGAGVRHDVGCRPRPILAGTPTPAVLIHGVRKYRCAIMRPICRPMFADVPVPMPRGNMLGSGLRGGAWERPEESPAAPTFWARRGPAVGALSPFHLSAALSLRGTDQQFQHAPGLPGFSI